MSPLNRFLTHEVDNQPQPLADYNACTTDIALQEALQREGAAWASQHLSEYGALVGGELMALGFSANQHKPRLHPFDRYGHRVDEVEFHPAYHRIMQCAMQYGMHSYAWQHEAREGAHVARAAIMYLGYQADAGSACPMSMTYASIPSLLCSAELAEQWVPKLTATQYDARSLPAQQKTSCTIGMGMTEKQGGSDVRTNTTTAERQADGSYLLIGHKWFFSAPMSDAHLVLAQAEQGLTCFLVPRLLDDGSRNGVEIQRLKDKLGDWSNASSEVEFKGALGWRVGIEGRGIPVILEMVRLTRLDCMTGSAALMRQATVQALHHCRHRSAFGKALIDQPLMRNVLADLALESEAALALSFRVARAIDSAERNPHESALARIATAIGKFWICKRTPVQVNEAMECLGGIGYVEDTMMPRLFRQSPLNSIWEGAGNVQCLDVLRAIRKEPETREALFAELLAARGADPHFDREVQALGTLFDDVETLELRSRHVVERIAVALQASILLQSNEAELARCFCASRLAGQHGMTLGTLSANAPMARLIERASVSGQG